MIVFVPRDRWDNQYLRSLTRLQTYVLHTLLTQCFFASFLFSSICASGEDAATTIILRGQSSGGILTLVKAPTGNYPFVEITNHPGDKPWSVISNLVRELEGCRACTIPYAPRCAKQIDDSSLWLRGGTLIRTGSLWLVGGTDTGFGMLPAPNSLTLSVSSNINLLHWENLVPYDSITLIHDGFPWAVLPGNATSYKHDLSGFPVFPTLSSDEHFYMVVGERAGMPSNGSGIKVKKRVEQQLLMNVPFTGGICPGWEPWQDNTNSQGISLSQGNHPGMYAKADVLHFNGGGFYQIISGNKSVSGGVGRRFLKLPDEHTYRVSARMNTLHMKDGDWSFSFHAAYNSPSGEALSPQQMAGVAELPDKSKGPDAGLISRFDSSANTGGAWVTKSSRKAELGHVSSDIALPNGVTSITVWFRHEGTGVTNSAVAFDSVILEDLGKKLN